jgi:CheY-like chemotaxis protein
MADTPDPMKSFGETATGLARNPLGIIALFIVLVYGFASLVTAFAGSFSSSERLPLIWFMVIFPILVLLVFAWLVRWHSGKLFGPSDFKDEANYVKMQMTAVASLVAATANTNKESTPADVDKLVAVVREAAPSKRLEADSWKNHILWVDDRPNNNVYERQAFEAVGLRFTIALSTNEALDIMQRNKFAAIVSDMGRKEGSREGYVLLDAIRKQSDQTPLFFYAGSNSPEHKRETLDHGGQGCTNNAQELFQMVTRAVISRT